MNWKLNRSTVNSEEVESHSALRTLSSPRPEGNPHMDLRISGQLVSAVCIATDENSVRLQDEKMVCPFNQL